MPGVLFTEAAPTAGVSPNRADVACFIGFVQRRSTAVPPSVKEALVAGGWHPAGEVRDDHPLQHKPVLVENFETFDHLFKWEDRGGSGHSTWLGAAVRSFFAQGGARCYVVRADDPPALNESPSASLRDSLLGLLLPKTSKASHDQQGWKGLEVLLGLDEVAFVCLPDLPEIMRDAAVATPLLPEPPAAPEEFVECSATAATTDKAAKPPSESPACLKAGYEEWCKAAHTATAFVLENRRDVELILAVPIPAEGSLPQGNPLHLNRVSDNPAVSSAFLQLVYPWLATEDSSALPGGLEPPDGAFAGVAARTIIALGAHRSLARQPLQRIARFYPTLPERDYQLLAPRDENPALIHRVSLLGQTPNGPAVLSDVTTSLHPSHRPAGVGRLTAAILRTAQRLGEEVVFDVSGPDLWRKIEGRLTNLLSQFHRAGALLGPSAEEAFSVRCDDTTMTQNDRDHGRVKAIVEFAPAHPVGVITVTLSLRTGAALAAAALEGSNV